MTGESEKLRTVGGRKIFNISYLVLGVLIFLTLGVTYNFYKSAQNKDITRFRNQVNRLSGTIDNQIKLYRAMLKGSGGFVEASTELNREKFALYIGNLDLQNRYTGIQGIGFSQYFPVSEKENLTRKLSGEGYENFNIFPAAERSYQSAIIFLEPLNDRNRSALGFDMLSESVRREAMERARDSGEIAASGKVSLLDESGGEGPAGFLLYIPVYEGGRLPDLPEEKDRNLRGFVYSPFRASEFLGEIYQTVPDKDIRIEIYDESVRPEALLAETETDGEPDQTGIMDARFIAKQEIDVGGRKWVIQFSSLSGFAEQSSVSWTPLIFLCGIGFSFLLFGMTYWEAASRAKVQRTAAKLFELQKDKERLFEDEKKARLTAEQANQTKDEFISIISHELKTPLNAIAGWAQIMKTEQISEQTKNLALQKIDKNLRAQAELVEQLLGYSEIISGKIRLNEELIDFSELFEQACAETEALAGEKKVEFVRENHLDTHRISGDRDKLKIVLKNLLLNAIKFTPPGGRVEALVRESDDFIEMRVMDNGRGISSEFLPHVFDNYKQADNPNTRDYGGLGLGLTIARHIIKLHDGQIFAESAGRGKGAAFTVKIPIDHAFSK